MNVIIFLMNLMFLLGFATSQRTRAELRKRFNAQDFVFDLARSSPTQGDGGIKK